MEDGEILRLLRARDPQGLEALVKKYGRLISYVARGVLDNDSEAEECAGDVYLSLWEKAAAYDPERGGMPAWLTAIARNAAIDRLRASRRRESFEGAPLNEQGRSTDTPEEALLRAERTRLLQQAVSHLSSTEHALFYRKYYYMQSTRQIAAEMRLPERAVEGRLYRLRLKLRQLLGGEL